MYEIFTKMGHFVNAAGISAVFHDTFTKTGFFVKLT